MKNRVLKIMICALLGFTPLLSFSQMNPLPVLDSIRNFTLCVGETFPILYFTGTDVDTVTWKVTMGSGTDIGMNSIIGKNYIPAFVAASNIPAQVIRIEATPKSSAGCTGESKTFTITVNSLPKLAPLENMTFCSGDTFPTLYFSGNNVDEVEWIVTYSTGIGHGIAGSGKDFIPSFVTANNSTVPDIIGLEVTPKSIVCGAGETKSFIITVNPLPVLSQPKNIAFCAGKISTPISFFGANIDTVSWQVTSGSGTAIGMPANSGKGIIPPFAAVNIGSVTITATPKSIAGCEGKSQTFTITIDSLPVLNPITDLTFCAGEVSKPIAFSGTNVNGITWEVIAGSGTAIGMSANNGTGSILPFTTVNTTPDDVSATVKVTPVSPAGCMGDSLTFTITVDAKTVLDINLGNDTMICRADTLLLNAEHPLADSYQWQNQSTKATYTVYHEAGQFWVIVKAHCNEKRDTINITHYTNLQVDLGKDLTFCEEDVISQKLHVNVNTPNVSYQWQDGSELPTYLVEKSGIYSVTVSNICMSVSDKIEVKIKDCTVLEVWIPNAFTPDEDGINDIFKPEISNPELLKEYEMVIYNRWGNLIFRTQDYLMGWNGKDNKGKSCSIGVYAAIVKYKDMEGQNFIRQVSITLVK